MTPRQTPAPTWWKLPSVIVGIVAGLGALGTVIVKGASYVTLPDKVEAVEAKNAQQDTLLTRLVTIEEQNQKLLDRSAVTEVNDDGEVKTLRMEGKTLCCDGTDCWPWHKKTACARR